MHLRRLTLFFPTALVLLFTSPLSHAATRARFRAETILNDPSVRIAAGDETISLLNEKEGIPLADKC